MNEEEFDRVIDEKVSQMVDEGVLAMGVDPETGEDIYWITPKGIEEFETKYGIPRPGD